MFKVFDYQCVSCGTLRERFLRASEATPEIIACECGHVASRRLAAPRTHLEGHSGHFPGAAMKWEREHEKAGRGSHFQPENE